MRRGRFIKGLSTIVALTALMAAGAHAAGGVESKKSAVNQQYSTSTTPTVGQPATPGSPSAGPSQAAQGSQPSNAVLGTPQSQALAPARRSSLPFTGVDLALLTVGGLGLLMLGAGLRRFARNKA